MKKYFLPFLLTFIFITISAFGLWYGFNDFNRETFSSPTNLPTAASRSFSSVQPAPTPHPPPPPPTPIPAPPAPTPVPPTLPKSSFHFQGRELIGPGLANYSINKNSLKFTNKINKNWQATLLKKLHSFQPPGTRIKIEKENSLIELLGDGKQGRYIEKVVVKTTLPDGKIFSYRANIDSESGKVLLTYDKIRYESSMPNRGGLSPSGKI